MLNGAKIKLYRVSCCVYTPKKRFDVDSLVPADSFANAQRRAKLNLHATIRKDKIIKKYAIVVKEVKEYE